MDAASAAWEAWASRASAAPRGRQSRNAATASHARPDSAATTGETAKSHSDGHTATRETRKAAVHRMAARIAAHLPAAAPVPRQRRDVTSNIAAPISEDASNIVESRDDAVAVAAAQEAIGTMVPVAPKSLVAATLVASPVAEQLEVVERPKETLTSAAHTPLPSATSPGDDPSVAPAIRTARGVREPAPALHMSATRASNTTEAAVPVRAARKPYVARAGHSPAEPAPHRTAATGKTMMPSAVALDDETALTQFAAALPAHLHSVAVPPGAWSQLASSVWREWMGDAADKEDALPADGVQLTMQTVYPVGASEWCARVVQRTCTVFQRVQDSGRLIRDAFDDSAWMRDICAASVAAHWVLPHPVCIGSCGPSHDTLCDALRGCRKDMLLLLADVRSTVSSHPSVGVTILRRSGHSNRPTVDAASIAATCASLSKALLAAAHLNVRCGSTACWRRTTSRLLAAAVDFECLRACAANAARRQRIHPVYNEVFFFAAALDAPAALSQLCTERHLMYAAGDGLRCSLLTSLALESEREPSNLSRLRNVRRTWSRCFTSNEQLLSAKDYWLPPEQTSEFESGDAVHRELMSAFMPLRRFSDVANAYACSRLAAALLDSAVAFEDEDSEGKLNTQTWCTVIEHSVQRLVRLLSDASTAIVAAAAERVLVCTLRALHLTCTRLSRASGRNDDRWRVYRCVSHVTIVAAASVDRVETDFAVAVVCSIRWMDAQTSTAAFRHALQLESCRGITPSVLARAVDRLRSATVHAPATDAVASFVSLLTAAAALTAPVAGLDLHVASVVPTVVDGFHDDVDDPVDMAAVLRLAGMDDDALI